MNYNYNNNNEYTSKEGNKLDLDLDITRMLSDMCCFNIILHSLKFILSLDLNLFNNSKSY